MQRADIVLVVKKIVGLLVAGKYDDLFVEDYKKVITAVEMRDAVLEYDGVLTLPPENEFGDFDIYEVSSSEYSVDFDLWVNYKRSDLTLGCTIYKIDETIYYSIDNIHTL